MRTYMSMLLALVVHTQVFTQCTCSNISSGPCGDQGGRSLLLEKGQWMGALYGELRQFSLDGTSAEHQHHSTGTSSQMIMLQNAGIATTDIAYGLCERVTLSARLPFVRLNAAPVSAYGIADAMLLGTWKFFERTEFSAALMAGLELPTGVRSGLSTETSTGIGSGSWDPVAGISAVKGWKRNVLRASVFYRYSTFGYDGVNYGSFISHNTMYSHTFYEKNNCGTDSIKDAAPFSWRLFAGILGELNGQQFKSNSVFVSNTGGYVLLAELGTSFTHGKFSMPLSFSLPLFQTYNGMQSPVLYRMKIGLIRTF